MLPDTAAYTYYRDESEFPVLQVNGPIMKSRMMMKSPKKLLKMSI